MYTRNLSISFPPFHCLRTISLIPFTRQPQQLMYKQNSMKEQGNDDKRQMLPPTNIEIRFELFMETERFFTLIFVLFFHPIIAAKHSHDKRNDISDIQMRRKKKARSNFLALLQIDRTSGLSLLAELDNQRVNNRFACYCSTFA